MPREFEEEPHCSNCVRCRVFGTMKGVPWARCDAGHGDRPLPLERVTRERYPKAFRDARHCGEWDRHGE
jgi:hypothetical protein